LARLEAPLEVGDGEQAEDQEAEANNNNEVEQLRDGLEQGIHNDLQIGVPRDDPQWAQSTNQA
jgi:hypothetical protein